MIRELHHITTISTTRSQPHATKALDVCESLLVIIYANMLYIYALLSTLSKLGYSIATNTIDPCILSPNALILNSPIRHLTNHLLHRHFLLFNLTQSKQALHKPPPPPQSNTHNYTLSCPPPQPAPNSSYPPDPASQYSPPLPQP